ncbi:Type-1 restriction enzyme EcoKI specificity protein [termite gut metagenome]|uniref:Type-1 restriction enzyme EcoKI specificity protein n=1 Tax=termite gut metagenome TaxID=433724 RepID=A0A5J4SDB3_9ZZZZ
MAAYFFNHLQNLLKNLKMNNDIHIIPENWVQTSVGEIVLYTKGRKPDVLKEKIFKDSTPYLDINAFEKRIEKYADKETSISIKEEDIVIVWDGSRSGLVLKGKKGSLGSTLAKINTFSINETFIFYFLLSKYEYLNKNTKGIGIPHINPLLLNELEIALPPLNEQYRIVEKIEELFSEIEHVEKSLINVNKLLNVYWQVILSNAFKSDNYSFLGSKTELITKGASPKWQGFNYVNDNKQTLFITSENIQDNHIDNSKAKYVEDSFNEKQPRSVLKRSDILLNIVGASIGRAACFNQDNKANINQAVALIRTSSEIDPLFLMYYLNSKKARDYYQIRAVDVARANLSLADVSDIPIPNFEIEVQRSIAQELDSQNTVIKNIEDNIHRELKRIDVLKQSILSKAFTGKLVSQNPNDESASELLKKIQNERIAFLQNKITVKKVVKKKMKQTKSVLELLQETQNPILAKELWQQSKHSDNIDDFYAELKILIEKRKIEELPRRGKESYLKLIQDENR